MNGSNTQGVDKEIVGNGGQSSNVKIVELPVIPREVADAIEFAKKVHQSNMNIIDDVFMCEGSGDERMEYLSRYFSGRENTLISALINGYIVEKSPEEKVREYYDDKRALARSNIPSSVYLYGICTGIGKTLDLLGIKIEGVND